MSTDPTRRLLVHLRDELEEGVRTQTSQVVHEPEIAKALEWLSCCRRPEGYWGEMQDGTTCLALLAFSVWAEATPVPGSAATPLAVSIAADFDFETTAGWIEDQRDMHGRWLTPWYTAMAVQALCAASHRGPGLRDGIEELRGLDPDKEQFWHDRVHHAAQVLCALGQVGADAELLDRWALCVLDNATTELSPYVAGQAVHALLRWSTTAPADVRHLTAPLESFLERTALSKSALLDYAPALRALALVRGDQRGTGLDRLVGSKARELFSRMEKGSWYRDAEMTAWALLSLREVGSVTQVVVDKGSFNQAFSQAIRQAPLQQRRQRRQVAALTLALVLVVALATAIALANPAESVLLAGMAVGAGVPITAWIGRELTRRLR